MIAVFDIQFGRDYVYFSQLKVGDRFRFRFPEFHVYGVLEKAGGTSARDVFTRKQTTDIKPAHQVFRMVDAKPLNPISFNPIV